MDEIRLWCTRFQSIDRAEHDEAYGWLILSLPFMAVFRELHEQGFSVHEVAYMLADGAEGALAENALDLLKVAVDRSGLDDRCEGALDIGPPND
jgi:hypothetical protein